eukprot:355515-Chlamydomonas_euryale.AAC.11
MTSALSKYDVLLTPAAPTSAYKLGEKTSDPLSMYKASDGTQGLHACGCCAVMLPQYLPFLLMHMMWVMLLLGDLMTVNVNLAGLPAVVVPCAYPDGLPVGVQMIGRAFDEAHLLNIAHTYEQTAGIEAPVLNMAA